jgi:hypothetical protein
MRSAAKFGCPAKIECLVVCLAAVLFLLFTARAVSASTPREGPPDTDGFWGRYQPLVNDVVYLLPVGALALGAIYLMPEETSNWDRDSITLNEVWDNWKDNVGNWQWDKDDTWINLLGHPYFGSAYVVYARHYGYSPMESLDFSFTASFFYEVGLEGWVEPVSIQDVILTPLLGFCLAELLLPLEERIRKNNNRLLGSDFLGGLSLFLIDPFGHMIRPVKRWAGNMGPLGEAELHLSPVPHGVGFYQPGSDSRTTTFPPCYGLFLTVKF